MVEKENGREQKSLSRQQRELTVKDIFVKCEYWLAYLKRKWLLFALVSLTGAVCGLFYAIKRPAMYTARLTFVLGDAGSSSTLSQYSALASLAGIDVSKGTGGLFDPANILELYKTRLMIQKTLLAEVVIDKKPQLLIERYIAFNGLTERFRKAGILPESFRLSPEKFSRTQDSVISDLVVLINKKYLLVNKLEKDLSIIKVEYLSPDEKFAQAFTVKLVETVNDFYTQTKTKKATQNVLILQRQADSVRRVLNQALSGVATAIDANPNPNPALVRLNVPSQRRQVDVQASTAVYSEIIKNLELSKISLRNETPLIEVIDKPVLPLDVSRLSKAAAILIGAMLSGVILAVCLVARKAFFKLIQ